MMVTDEFSIIDKGVWERISQVHECNLKCIFLHCVGTYALIITGTIYVSFLYFLL